MKLIEFLAPHDVLANLRADDKETALTQMCAFISRVHPEVSENASSVLLHREQLGSTGIGGAIAIPHGKLDSIEKLIACVARSQAGIPFDAMDGAPVKLLFVLLAPRKEAGLHLKALARIAKLMRQHGLHDKLMSARDAAEMYRILTEEDKGL